MLKIGIIGCGTIGSRIAAYIDGKLKGKAKVTVLSDADGKKAKGLSAKLKARPRVASISAMISSVDLVIEAASAKVSGDIARRAVNAGKDVMVMSTGGLLKDHKALFKLADKKKSRIYLPSGAICGLDGLKSAKLSGIRKVTLTTRKPPQGFNGAPYVVKHNIDLGKIKSERVLFEGDALKAMEGFPANINVAATLSLCGIGPEKTKVKIIASPSIKRNIHEIEVEGAFGRLTARTENVPSPGNPKTSYMAVLSAMATLDGILEKVKIGT
jgi:aspartate dehydrogenase